MIKTPFLNKLLLAILIVPFGGSPSHSQTIYDVVSNIPKRLHHRIKKDPEQYIENAMKSLFSVNSTGTATRREFEQFTAVNSAGERLHHMKDFLHADLNGDGAVTKAELILVAKYKPVYEGVQNQLLFLKADQDKNGTVSFVELSNYAQSEVKIKQDRNKSSGSVHGRLNVMIFDINKDDVVDAAELVEAIEGIAATPITKSEPVESKRRKAKQRSKDKKFRPAPPFSKKF